MADRVEREIEEILAKLDSELPPETEKKPIPILSRKRAKRSQPPKPARPSGRNRSSMTPTSAMFTALAWWWAAGPRERHGAAHLDLVRRCRPFPGGVRVVVLPRAPTQAARPKGVYWRDRYIEYEPASPGLFDRIKRALRR